MNEMGQFLKWYLAYVFFCFLVFFEAKEMYVRTHTHPSQKSQLQNK